MASTNGPTMALPEISLSYLLASLLSLAAFVFLVLKLSSSGRGPRALADPIPRVFNTLQFMLNNHKFMIRVQNAMRDSSVVRCYLGPKAVYLVTGQQGLRTVFGRELVHSVTNQEQMTGFALPTLYRMKPDEVRRWENDKSGVTKIPISGTEHMPSRQRLWFNYEHIYAEYLGKPQYVKPQVDMFRHTFGTALERYSADEWKTISILELCRGEIAGAAISVLFGPDLVKLTPDFIDRFWSFDEHVFSLVLGIPKWINSAPSKAHDRYVAAIETWLNRALTKFDWEGPDAEADWEPRFGARAVREMVKWMKETGWRTEVIAATMGALAFA